MEQDLFYGYTNSTPFRFIDRLDATGLGWLRPMVGSFKVIGVRRVDGDKLSVAMYRSWNRLRRVTDLFEKHGYVFEHALTFGGKTGSACFRALPL